MKNPTLKQIKEMYPEGCEVACVLNEQDKQIVKHDKIINGRDSFGLIGQYNITLWTVFSGFATITKEAPKSSFDNMFPDPDSEIQRIVKKYNLQPLKLSSQTESIAEAFNNKLEQIKKQLNFDVINYIDKL
jgi:Glu-tRNA(Gln) amidotransferase subunit E-like FAD-binding protein